MNKISDTALIDRILGGDISGYSILVDRYKDLAFTLAFRITGIREDAEEVVQDAFLSAYKGLGRFRQKAKFPTWLYRIVYNKAVSRKRLKTKQMTSIDEAATFIQSSEEVYESEGIAVHEERSWLLGRAMDSLNPEDRTLVTLFYMNEQSINEIHAVTGLSRANVKVRLFRARKKLHEVLEKHSDLVFV